MSENEFVSYLLELLEPIGNIRAKKMFGGYGIYKNDVIFSIVADEIFYLKADDVNRKDFEKLGLQKFTYRKKSGDKDFSMSYYQAPEHAMEDSQELCSWAEKSIEAALRAKKTN